MRPANLSASTSVGHIDTAAEFRYAAFISYRHADVDRKWAHWLHSALEGYRVPSRIAKARRLGRTVGRVFLDEQELAASSDLNEDIDAALRQSKFLIVVCSPRTPESRWVTAEIERFRQMGRGNHILALLIEGEPEEAFPPALRAVHPHKSEAAGGEADRTQAIEPLAADVRPSGRLSLRRRRFMALLRLMARLLGVTFDDLHRRGGAWNTRHLVPLVVSAGVLSVLAAVSTWRVGITRSTDLKAWDSFVRNRPRDTHRAADIVVVGISDRNVRRGTVHYPLTDQEMADLVEKLLSYNPRAVGIDIFRGTEVRGYNDVEGESPGRRRLAAMLANDSRIVLPFRISPDRSLYAKPAFLPDEQAVLSDYPVDGDGVVRRGLLFAGTANGTYPSFASLVTQLYLAQEKLPVAAEPVPPDDPGTTDLKLGQTTYRHLRRDEGPYEGNNILD